MAKPAAPTATLRVVPGWTDQDGGKLTGKTKPGKYTIALLCEDKHQVPDSVDVKSVRIYTVLGAFQQPDQPLLPNHFTPDVTVSAGPPAAAHPKKKKKGH
jgi:hypothetical protein